MVKAWGDRTLTTIQLEDRIATAAEKSPLEDENIASLRKAINLIKEEYQEVIKARRAKCSRCRWITCYWY